MTSYTQADGTMVCAQCGGTDELSYDHGCDGCCSDKGPVGFDGEEDPHVGASPDLGSTPSGSTITKAAEAAWRAAEYLSTGKVYGKANQEYWERAVTAAFKVHQRELAKTLDFRSLYGAGTGTCSICGKPRDRCTAL